jgi:dihydroorotate dehydrogenase
MSNNGLVLRGVRFNPIFGASGTLGNFREGYAYHDYLKGLFPESFDFTGATFISKTTTDAPREGNMPLDEHFQPREFLPKCIYANPFKSIALNAVGLSGPGINALLNTEGWQNYSEPFFISFMAADGKNLQERLSETEKFAKKLKVHLRYFLSKVGVQKNISCPNTKQNPAEFVRETIEHGLILRLILEDDVPLDLKINAMAPLKAYNGPINLHTKYAKLRGKY